MIDGYIKLIHEYGCIGLQIWLHRVTNMAASGYEYGCIGLRIWLHRVTNTAASGYEYDCVG